MFIFQKIKKICIIKCKVLTIYKNNEIIKHISVIVGPHQIAPYAFWGGLTIIFNIYIILTEAILRMLHHIDFKLEDLIKKKSQEE
jgi:hypothetical protein